MRENMGLYRGKRKDNGEFRMVLCEKYKNYTPGCGFYAIRCFDKEVIGNIHDNPELLEVSGDE